MPPPRALTSSQLRELETELHIERTRLERTFSESPDTDRWSGATGGDPADASGAGTVGVLQTHTDARYDAIIAALARLDEGSYGICVDCRQPIPYGRLIAIPEATSCIGCRPYV